MYNQAVDSLFPEAKRRLKKLFQCKSYSLDDSGLLIKKVGGIDFFKPGIRVCPDLINPLDRCYIYILHLKKDKN